MKSNKIKTPIYLQTWFIAILFALWLFILPAVLGVYLLIKKYQFEKNVVNIYNKQIDDLSKANADFKTWYESEDTQEEINNIKNWNKDLDKRQASIKKLDETKLELIKEVADL